MRKIQYLILCLVLLSACKNDKTNNDGTDEVTTSEVENDGLTLLEGNFIYYDDAAVFQTTTSLFGVVLNEKSEELVKQSKPLKKAETDMVKARVRGIIEEKPADEDGWDFRINIKKIISVEALPASANEVITLEKE
jgi:hypothetical protein